MINLEEIENKLDDLSKAIFYANVIEFFPILNLENDTKKSLKVSIKL